MDERVLRFRVGVVVFAAAMVTIVLVMLIGAWPTVFQSQYVLHIQFPEAPGITADTPVRKSGVLIGRVSDVKLLDEGGVLVSTNINQKYPLRQNETCRIGSGSILGDAVLEFVPSGQEELLVRFDSNKTGRLEPEEEKAARELLTNNEYINDGVVMANPMRVLVNLEDDLENAFASIESAGNEVAQLAETVNRSLDVEDGRVPRILEKTETALDGLNRAMSTVEGVLGDEELSERLRQTLRDLPLFVEEARETMAAARSSFDSFQRLSKRAEVNLENLEQFTEPLGENGPQIVQSVAESTDNLNQMLLQFVAFSESLNSGNGTLGRLVHDDQLYKRLDTVLINAEDLTKRLRPIVDDMRIFTDKIAREPSQLGVRGALDRRPSGLKTGISTW